MDKDSLRRALDRVDTLYQVTAVFKHWAQDPENVSITFLLKLLSLESMTL
jgi:hypothetical protein